jgi:hypothetical protein
MKIMITKFIKIIRHKNNNLKIFMVIIINNLQLKIINIMKQILIINKIYMKDVIMIQNHIMNIFSLTNINTISTNNLIIQIYNQNNINNSKIIHFKININTLKLILSQAHSKINCNQTLSSIGNLILITHNNNQVYYLLF